MEIAIAGYHDIDFITEAILESEKSGTDTTGWQRILDISEAEFVALVRQVLEEEVEGQEWHIPNFRILREGEQNVAALSIWEEASSGILKSQAISWFLPEKWQAATVKLQEVQKVQIPRLAGALQLENIYTRPVFRGRGYVSQLIDKAIEDMHLRNPLIQTAEIQLMTENRSAMQAYIKCGFIKRAESAETGDAVLTLLPGRSRTSLIKEINHGNS